MPGRRRSNLIWTDTVLVTSGDITSLSECILEHRCHRAHFGIQQMTYCGGNGASSVEDARLRGLIITSVTWAPENRNKRAFERLTPSLRSHIICHLEITPTADDECGALFVCEVRNWSLFLRRRADTCALQMWKHKLRCMCTHTKHSCLRLKHLTTGADRA